MQISASRTSARALAAPILEVFASIQGEGLYVGQPQTFLRLYGCPLRCRWCDTPGSWLTPTRAGERRGHARIAGPTGARRADAWATPFQAATWIAEVESGQARTISVTGGEPLMWPAFLADLSTFAGSRRVHLETGGGHPDTLARVLDAVDHVSLDLKLPDDLDPPVPLDGEHEPSPRNPREWAEVRARCLELVRSRDACAKLVVSGGHQPRRFVPLLDDVAAIAPELPLFLQPVTPVGGVPAPDHALLRGLIELALDRSLDVRVVPQIHRALGLP